MFEAESGAPALYGPWRGRWRCTPEGLSEHHRHHLTSASVETYQEIRGALDAQVDGESLPVGSVLSGFCEVCWALIATRWEVTSDDDAPLGKRSERRLWYAARSGVGWKWSKSVGTYEDLSALIGDHEHNTDLPAGQVRYYVTHPTGPFKSEHQGTWFDVVEDIPLAIFGLFEPPTLDQLNELLNAGGASAGMSGGIEVPRHRLSEDDWKAIYRRMVAIGRFTEDRPAAGLDGSDLLEWLLPRLERFHDGQERRGRR